MINSGAQVEVKVSEVALNIMKRRVLFTKENGEQEEPIDAYIRAATFVASGHNKFSSTEETKKFRDKAINMMANGKFMPNTPTLVNAGFPNAQCSACFVLPINDNLPSIYKAHYDQGLVQASGGGTGFFLGDIRSAGTKAAGRFITRGPINWLRMLNENAIHVAQGMRDGANMAILDIRHPDIMEFIRCKRYGYSITSESLSEQFGISLEEAARIKAVSGIEKFNISVSITDDFIVALEREDVWEFIDPHTKLVTGSMPSHEIWNEIVQNAWEHGEPGLFFEDTVNKHNMLLNRGRIRATNPCGEQPRRPYESCNLGHVNLSKFIIGMNGSSSIDWSGLEETLRFGVQFLDDVVEINSFPIKELDDMNRATRNIGLGIMGWADMLAKLGIPYDSNDAIVKACETGDFIKNVVEDETTRLGQDRGNFPYFEGSGFQADGLKYRRNNDTSTIAPTGQTSLYANCSSSIEPLIFPVIVRNQGGLTQVEYHPALFEMLEDRGLNTEEVKDKLGKLGSVRKADFLPDDIKSIFPSSHDIDHLWHIEHQIAWQVYISSGVSKTINFHSDATKKDVCEAFKRAYYGGCKGITVYRDGSRLSQPLSAVKKESEKITQPIDINKRDVVTFGTNRKIENGCGNLMVYVGNGENGKIQEITARLGKGGGCASAQTEAIARMASIAIQHGVDPHYIARQLGGIRCHLTGFYRSKYTGKRPRIITSCADAMSVAISEHLANGSDKAEYAKRDDHVGACPECGGQLSFEEGCSKCYNCGFSRC